MKLSDYVKMFPTKRCAHCREEFVARNSTTARTCSTRCRVALHRKRSAKEAAAWLKQKMREPNAALALTRGKRVRFNGIEHIGFTERELAHRDVVAFVAGQQPARILGESLPWWVHARTWYPIKTKGKTK